MSQLSFTSFDDALLVRDAQGRYLPASVDQMLEAARQRTVPEFIRQWPQYRFPRLAMGICRIQNSIAERLGKAVLTQ